MEADIGFSTYLHNSNLAGKHGKTFISKKKERKKGGSRKISTKFDYFASAESISQAMSHYCDLSSYDHLSGFLIGSLLIQHLSFTSSGSFLKEVAVHMWYVCLEAHTTPCKWRPKNNLWAFSPPPC